jgi:alpha/beta superfamily hydrolase
MNVELVRVTTADGHRLDGALQVPLSATPRPCSVDACLILHGVGGNFYSSKLLEFLADRIGQLGVATLRVNTRGHDSLSICWTSTGPIRQGAMYEVVDQCRYDVAAWVGLLRERGFLRLVLLGHSLGAIKVIYSQAFDAASEVKAVVACSAPRLSYSAFMNSESQPRFFESVTAAREQIDKGQPEAIIQSKFPFPMVITAASFLDKYGPDERYNILKFVDRVPCPLLVTYGELELDRGGIAFAGMPEAVVSRRRPDQSLKAVTIPGADHVYSGVFDRLAAEVTAWMDTGEGSGFRVQVRDPEP